MFGDTFLGALMPDRSREIGTPLINNAFVIHDNHGMLTFHGGTEKHPESLIKPKEDNAFFWPVDGTISDGKLVVFCWKFFKRGHGPWDWQWWGTELAIFSLSTLRMEALIPLNFMNGIRYGSAVMETENYIYIYGVEDLKDKKYAHVARVKHDGILGQWTFFSDNGWTSNPLASKRILEGTANQFSVFKYKGNHILITMDNRYPFLKDVILYQSEFPWGPFIRSCPIYKVPERREGMICYNAVVHPQFTSEGKILISYNINFPDHFHYLFEDADNYRPWFIRADLESVLRSPPLTGKF